MESNWGAPEEGTSQFTLCCKLKLVKRPLKQLNKLHFMHISRRAERETEALKEAQMKLHDDPINEGIQMQLDSLRREAWRLGEIERKFYFQKAKCQFLKATDKCTKFFHDLVKKNAHRNHVGTICREDGSFTTSQAQVAEEFVPYFSSLLGSCS